MNGSQRLRRLKKMVTAESEPPNSVTEIGDQRYYVSYRRKTRVWRNAKDWWRLPPVALAQLGLGWLEIAMDGQPPAWEAVRRICDLVVQQASWYGDEAIWRDFRQVRKYRLSPPWLSGMAQGQIASLLVRAGLQRDNEVWLGAGKAAALGMLNEKYGLWRHGPNGPVVEEVVTTPPSSILNGWIFGIWGLWDASSILQLAEVARAADESVICLERQLPLYDAGWWSRYSLYPHVLADIAKPEYHRLHITQLEMTGRLAGSRALLERADRWREYETRHTRPIVLAHKCAFGVLARVGV